MKITEKDILKRFNNYLLNEKGLSQNTIEAYLRDVSLFFDFYKRYSNSEDLNIKDIDRIAIRHYLGKLSEDGLKNTTISRKLSAIKILFKHLVATNILQKNPAALIKSPKKENNVPDVLSENEIKNILNEVESNDFYGARNKAIIELFYSTGMRLSELVSINLNNIDISNKEIKITGKGNKERLVLLSERVIKTINNYIRKREEKYDEIKKNSPLFISNRKQRISISNVQFIMKNILNKFSEKNDLSSHTLRHTFATHLLDNGADLTAVKELLGHESLSSTQIYTHIKLKKMKELYNLAHPHAKNKGLEDSS